MVDPSGHCGIAGGGAAIDTGCDGGGPAISAEAAAVAAAGMTGPLWPAVLAAIVASVPALGVPICLANAGCRAFFAAKAATGWQALCNSSSDSTEQKSNTGGRGGSDTRPTAPSAPDGMTNTEFGKFMEWGLVSDDARAQIPTLDADRLRAGGLTAEKAQEWADFYDKIAAWDPYNKNAPGRHDLMEAAAKVLRGEK